MWTMDEMQCDDGKVDSSTSSDDETEETYTGKVMHSQVVISCAFAPFKFTDS